jgi:hypothetical protein
MAHREARGARQFCSGSAVKSAAAAGLDLTIARGWLVLRSVRPLYLPARNVA